MERINRKQSTSGQHLSGLKATVFFSLQIFLVVMKHSNLYLGLVLPSGGWQSLIENDAKVSLQKNILFNEQKCTYEYSGKIKTIKYVYNFTLKEFVVFTFPEHSSMSLF